MRRIFPRSRRTSCESPSPGRRGCRRRRRRACRRARSGAPPPRSRHSGGLRFEKHTLARRAHRVRRGTAATKREITVSPPASGRTRRSARSARSPAGTRSSGGRARRPCPPGSRCRGRSPPRCARRDRSPSRGPRCSTTKTRGSPGGAVTKTGLVSPPRSGSTRGRDRPDAGQEAGERKGSREREQRKEGTAEAAVAAIHGNPPRLAEAPHPRSLRLVTIDAGLPNACDSNHGSCGVSPTSSPGNRPKAAGFLGCATSKRPWFRGAAGR